MKEKKAVRIKVETHCILEDMYEFITIEREKDVQLFCITPLITCFAFILFYKTRDSKEHAILYHAKSGYPDRLAEIYKVIAPQFSYLTKVIIATPHAIEEGNTAELIDLGKKEVRYVFNDYKNSESAYETVEESVCYFVNTAGEHGISALKHINSDAEAIKETVPSSYSPCCLL